MPEVRTKDEARKDRRKLRGMDMQGLHGEVQIKAIEYEEARNPT